MGFAYEISNDPSLASSDSLVKSFFTTFDEILGANLPPLHSPRAETVSIDMLLAATANEVRTTLHRTSKGAETMADDLSRLIYLSIIGERPFSIGFVAYARPENSVHFGN